jgi:heme/copper-type cytochrome/quinol oxidase subunit 2
MRKAETCNIIDTSNQELCWTAIPIVIVKSYFIAHWSTDNALGDCTDHVERLIILNKITA